MLRRSSILVPLFVFLPALPAAAQDPLGAALETMDLREIGPAIMGGRVSDIAAVEANPAKFYVGLAAGGLWVTENHGSSWTPLFDGQPCSSVGAVAVSQANPNVVWVGTGEPQNRQSSPYGCGVFRSTDGGRTWRDLGLTESRHVARIRLHPTDPDVAYVAAVGHLFGPNQERGVYRTTDGGATWVRVLWIDENTGAVDLVMDPGDPRTLFAAMYQRRRTSFGFSASGGSSGIYRTTDGGDSWTGVTEGLPQGEKGRIGLDVYRRDGNLLYATVEAGGDDGGLFRSEDRGETWRRVSTRNPRPMYFSLVRIDPNNPERIYLGGVSLSASDDGGRTWWDGDVAEGVHVDHHALWVDPSNSLHVLIGNDGGVASSLDGARTWRLHNNFAIGQFYEVGVDSSDPYRVCGGLQDNSSWCGPSHATTGYGILNRDWVDVSGGDGFYNQFDPADANILYTESQGGNARRVNLVTSEVQRIRPVARPTDDDPDREYRYNWNTPLAPSHHAEGTLYLGSNHLLRSLDRGVTWEEASPDLTQRIDRDTLLIMGAPVTRETLASNDGVSDYGTITVVEESPRSADVIYVGTDDGNLQVTRDGGGTWTNVVGKIRDLPARSYVSGIEASHDVDGRVYVAFDRHYDDDYRPYLYVSEDFGASWKSIVAGLPDWSVNVVREHPRSPDMLFLGNEIGLYASLDRGTSWHRLAGLPTVAVDDVVVHPRDNDLVVGTHGRSIWILDDLAPLEAMSGGGVFDRGAYVFSVPVATQWFELGAWPFWGDLYVGMNPRAGATIRYWLRDDLEEGPRIAITTATGETVRELSGPGAAGMNQVVWDLREAVAGADADTQEDGPQGPLVLPGTYLAHLEVGNEVVEQEIQVRLDPNVQANMGQLRARQAAARSAATIQAAVRRAQTALGRVADQISEAGRLLEETASDSTLLAEARAMGEELDSLRARIADASPGRLFGAIEGTAQAPTADVLWQLDRAWERVPPLVDELNGFITERVPAFNRRLDQAGVRPDPGEPVEVPRRPGW